MTMIDAAESMLSDPADNRGRMLAVALSGGIHLVLLMLLLWQWHVQPTAISGTTAFVMEFVSAAATGGDATPPSADISPKPAEQTVPAEPAKPAESEMAVTPPRIERMRPPVSHPTLAAQNGSVVSLSQSASASASGTAAANPSVKEGDSGEDANVVAQAVEHPHPDYPPQARRMRQEGEVMVIAQVGSDGAVLSASVERSSGFSLLDDAAVAALMRWRFSPAQEHGRPVAATVRVPVRFRLNE